MVWKLEKRVACFLSFLDQGNETLAMARGAVGYNRGDMFYSSVSLAARQSPSFLPRFLMWHLFVTPAFEATFGKGQLVTAKLNFCLILCEIWCQNSPPVRGWVACSEWNLFVEIVNLALPCLLFFFLRRNRSSWVADDPIAPRKYIPFVFLAFLRKICY